MHWHWDQSGQFEICPTEGPREGSNCGFRGERYLDVPLLLQGPLFRIICVSEYEESGGSKYIGVCLTVCWCVDVVGLCEVLEGNKGWAVEDSEVHLHCEKSIQAHIQLLLIYFVEERMQHVLTRANKGGGKK